MPTKKDAIKASVSDLFYEDVIEIAGVPVKFKLDVASISAKMPQIEELLIGFRRMKTAEALEFLGIADPVVKLVFDNLEYLKDDNEERVSVAVNIARNHYLSQLRVTSTHAALLAMIEDNEFEGVEVTPYAPSDNKPISGFGAPLPELVPDIRHPIERKLKQLLELLAKDPAKQAQVNAFVEKAQVKITEQAQEIDRLSGSTF